MTAKQVFAVPVHGVFGDTSLLLIRLVAGPAFIVHGWGKVQDPFNWQGEGGFAPGWLQAIAAVSEFGGGILWTLGLLTPLGSLAILCVMSGALYMHVILNGDPFVAQGASWELAAVYFTLALVLAAVGPGRFSADQAIFGPRLTASKPLAP